MDVHSFSLEDTTRLLTNTLRRAFPRTRFRIYPNLYFNCAAIDVLWTDGPNLVQVQMVAESFEGQSCPRLSSLKFRSPELEFAGEVVSFQVDYVHCHRRHSRRLLLAAASQVASECNLPILPVTGKARLLGGDHHVPFRYSPHTRSLSHDNSPDGGETYESLVLAVLNELSREAPSPVMLPARLDHKSEVLCGNISRMQLADELVAFHVRRARKAAGR